MVSVPGVRVIVDVCAIVLRVTVVLGHEVVSGTFEFIAELALARQGVSLSHLLLLALYSKVESSIAKLDTHSSVTKKPE